MYESDDGVSFQSEYSVPELPDFSKLVEWLQTVAAEEDKTITTLAYRFVSDDDLLELNQQFLKHNTFTDILTFPYGYEPIESDICISIDRVRDNALQLDSTIEEELLRVIVHGLLHMCGYSDETPEEKQAMRTRESYHLKCWRSID